jgi:hypothetical protein
LVLQVIDFFLGNINFTPSVMIKYVDPLPVQFELNAKFQYRDLLWLAEATGMKMVMREWQE